MTGGWEKGGEGRRVLGERRKDRSRESERGLEEGRVWKAEGRSGRGGRLA